MPEIPDELERVLVFALDEAKEKIEGGEDVIPFTTLVVKGQSVHRVAPGRFRRGVLRGGREERAWRSRGRLLRLLLRRLH